MCYTAFDWNTLRIENAGGIIHNPHYYDIQRRMGYTPREAGDFPCGGLPDVYRVKSLVKRFKNQVMDNFFGFNIRGFIVAMNHMYAVVRRRYIVNILDAK